MTASIMTQTPPAPAKCVRRAKPTPRRYIVIVAPNSVDLQRQMNAAANNGYKLQTFIHHGAVYTAAMYYGCAGIDGLYEEPNG